MIKIVEKRPTLEELAKEKEEIEKEIKSIDEKLNPIYSEISKYSRWLEAAVGRATELEREKELLEYKLKEIENRIREREIIENGKRY